MQPLTCPKCGTIPTHKLTDVNGSRYYQCNTGLARFNRFGTHWVDPCGTIVDDHGRLAGLDENGEPAREHLIFRTADKGDQLVLKSITVYGGQEL